MKTKHTPTPWAWQIDHPKDDKGTPPYNVCSIIGNTGDDERRHSTVATTITDDDDAKFITLACNHHEELVGVLEEIMDAYGENACECIQEPPHCAFCNARALLTKLKG